MKEKETSVPARMDQIRDIKGLTLEHYQELSSLSDVTDRLAQIEEQLCNVDVRLKQLLTYLSGFSEVSPGRDDVEPVRDKAPSGWIGDVGHSLLTLDILAAHIRILIDDLELIVGLQKKEGEDCRGGQ